MILLQWQLTGLIANGADTEMVKLCVVQLGVLLNLKAILFCSGLTGIMDGSNDIVHLYMNNKHGIHVNTCGSKTAGKHCTIMQNNDKYFSAVVGYIMNHDTELTIGIAHGFFLQNPNRKYTLKSIRQLKTTFWWFFVMNIGPLESIR